MRADNILELHRATVSRTQSSEPFVISLGLSQLLSNETGPLYGRSTARGVGWDVVNSLDMPHVRRVLCKKRHVPRLSGRIFSLRGLEGVRKRLVICEDHEAVALKENTEMLNSEICRQELPPEDAIALVSWRKLLRKESERVLGATDVLLNYTSNRTVGSLYHQALGSVVAFVHNMSSRSHALLDGSECAKGSVRPFKLALGRLRSLQKNFERVHKGRTFWAEPSIIIHKS